MSSAKINMKEKIKKIFKFIGCNWFKLAIIIILICFIRRSGYLEITNKELLVIILSPVIAVVVGEWLRKRNYNKQQRDNLVKKLIGYGYQMSPTYRSEKKEILEALNEIKYWYSCNYLIKELISTVMDKMESKQDAQDIFIKLVQAVAQKEGHPLSRSDIERVFSTR